MTITTSRPTSTSTSPSPSPGRRTRPNPVVRWLRYGGPLRLLFILPTIIVFGFFAWWPIVRSLGLSLQQTNFVTTRWVGFDNFTRVLADPLLGTATANTVWFATLALFIGFPVPILLAVIVSEMRRARAIASVLAYMPVILPPVVATLLWKAFYDPSTAGLFNSILGSFGLDPVAWLNNGDVAMPAIVVQATWASFGTATIIYLATLMSIGPELYEAAEVDGAGFFRRIWHITLPQLRSVILVLALLQIIGTLQVFAEPFIMTGGGPENRTVTILMLIYRYAFISGDYGRATALSLLLAVALTLLSLIYLRVTKKWSSS
jgi:multiple sugar transport system permease protein